jgi:hypothetical protein
LIQIFLCLLMFYGYQLPWMMVLLWLCGVGEMYHLIQKLIAILFAVFTNTNNFYLFNIYFMTKMTKIFLWFIWIIILFITVYASTASTRKSSKLPWQWNVINSYSSEHNVWNSYNAESRFTLNNWVVYDSVTKLYWQSIGNSGIETICKTYDTGSFITDTNCNDWNFWDDCNWCAAKAYCNALSLWSYTSGWKLPNIKELNSISDYTKNWTISMDANYFTATWSYWSSTLFMDPSELNTRAWYMKNSYINYFNLKKLNSNVRCVHY